MYPAHVHAYVRACTRVTISEAASISRHYIERNYRFDLDCAHDNGRDFNTSLKRIKTEGAPPLEDTYFVALGSPHRRRVTGQAA